MLGCGSKSTSSSTPANNGGTPSTAASSSGTGPSTLLGTYTRTVTKADIARTQHSRHEGPGQSAPRPGPSRLAITKSSLLTTDVNANITFAESYTADGGGRLTIKGYQDPAHRGAFCGPEIPQNATYRWKVSGGTLTLTAVSDPCADRDSSLSGHWTKR
jgi:hypothetical protein